MGSLNRSRQTEHVSSSLKRLVSLTEAIFPKIEPRPLTRAVIYNYAHTKAMEENSSCFNYSSCLVELGLVRDSV